jgi:hypothetical protein
MRPVGDHPVCYRGCDGQSNASPLSDDGMPPRGNVPVAEARLGRYLPAGLGGRRATRVRSLSSEIGRCRQKMPAQSLPSPNRFPAEFPLARGDRFECRQRAFRASYMRDADPFRDHAGVGLL